jgi:hypothetical protein
MSQDTFNTTHRLANELDSKTKDNVKLEAEISRIETAYKEEKEKMLGDFAE